MKPQPLFVAPDPAWNVAQVMEEFAIRQNAPKVVIHEDRTFSLGGPERYRMTLVGVAPARWCFAVFRDEENPA
jgi:hypothetical protein